MRGKLRAKPRGDAVALEDMLQGNQQGTDQVTDQVDPLVDPLHKLLLALRQQEQSAALLMRALGLCHTQRYRLTAKGKRVLG